MKEKDVVLINTLTRPIYIVFISMILSIAIGLYIGLHYSINRSMAANIISSISYGTFTIIAISPIIYMQMIDITSRLKTYIKEELINVASERIKDLDESISKFNLIEDELKKLKEENEPNEQSGSQLNSLIEVNRKMVEDYEKYKISYSSVKIEPLTKN